MTITHSPPLAPMTATLRLATLVVENCLARVDTGAWNLENMMIRRDEKCLEWPTRSLGLKLQHELTEVS